MSDEIILTRTIQNLAETLRRYHALTSFSKTKYERVWFPKLKSDLNLVF